jgi:hypothetical protein
MADPFQVSPEDARDTKPMPASTHTHAHARTRTRARTHTGKEILPEAWGWGDRAKTWWCWGHFTLQKA